MDASGALTSNSNAAQCVPPTPALSHTFRAEAAARMEEIARIGSTGAALDPGLSTLPSGAAEGVEWPSVKAAAVEALRYILPGLAATQDDAGEALCSTVCTATIPLMGGENWGIKEQYSSDCLGS